MAVLSLEWVVPGLSVGLPRLVVTRREVVRYRLVVGGERLTVGKGQCQGVVVAGRVLHLLVVCVGVVVVVATVVVVTAGTLSLVRFLVVRGWVWETVVGRALVVWKVGLYVVLLK